MIINKRTWIALVLSLLCVFLCTACNASGAQNASDTAESTPTVIAETEAETLPAGIRSKKATWRDMYDANDEKEALQVPKGETAGFRFTANAPFDSLTVCCPSWSDNIGTMRFTLFAWDKNHDITVSGTPLATEEYIDYNDNADLDFSFDEQPAGEYLLLISDTEQSVGVWNFFSEVSGGMVYKNGHEFPGEFQAVIHFTMTPEVPFSPCASQVDLNTVVKTPDPVVYPDDHILNVRNADPSTWDAVDGLGRVLPTNEETGDIREDRFVGLFYWTWHAVIGSSNEANNNTEIMAEYPEAKNDVNHPVWGNIGQSNHWDEPLYGYYTTVDKWVLRRHAELLADAGVDVIIFDNTNGTQTWRSSYITLLETFAEARADGVKTPQIAFLLPFSAGENTNIQLENLYLDIYRDSKYQELWFYWKGKPLIMAYPDALDRNDPLQGEIYDFFTFRPGQPSYTKGSEHKNQWGWLSIYPQQVYKNKDGTPEQMTVGVAQNHSAELGLTAMNGENIFGRTYTSEGYDTREDAVLWGANLAEQFEYALEVDPEFIFITGWNEWIASRVEEWQGVENAFPDQFDVTNSRDIEPSAGILKDHYYYQMVSYIRQFKGTGAAPVSTEQITVDIHGDVSQWDAVSAEYYAYIGNTDDRNADGYIGTHYENTTGRNDITLARVAHDADNLYFYVECAEDITADTDTAWMRLFLNTAESDAAWEGYEYILNREKAGVLERCCGGWSWEEVGAVDYAVDGHVLQVCIPKSLLGMTEDEFVLRFKWADNNLFENESGEVDILDFYQYGDAAPGERYQYRYTAQNP